MPRPIRVHLPGALYVVTSRAMEGSLLFRDAKDYETFLSFLQGYREQLGFKLFAYVLLPDYLQLCLELTGSTTVSEIMHDMNSRYTKYYTKRYGSTGHLFQERFKSTLMDKAPSALQLTALLHAQPRRLGLVADLRAYAWSSYQSYLIGGDGEVGEVLEQLAAKHPGTSYEAYVASMPERTLEQLDAQLREWVAGSDEFVAMVKARASALRQDPTRPAPQPSGPRLQGAPTPRRAGWLQRSPALAGSMAVAIVSLCATWLYARNLSSVREAMRAMAHERMVMAPSQLDDQSERATSARLASLTLPSRLNGTTWDVQVHSTTPTGEALVQRDRLQFEKGKVTSRQLSGQGFATSNYTLTPQPDGTIVWETMQTDGSGTVVCWRGEWNGQVMRGMLTRQAPGQPLVNFTFVGASQSEREPVRPTSET